MESGTLSIVVSGVIGIATISYTHLLNKKSKKKVALDYEEQNIRILKDVRHDLSEHIKDLNQHIQGLDKRISANLKEIENIKKAHAEDNEESLLKIKQLQRDNELCKYQHEVARLEQAQIKKQIGHHNYIIEDVAVLDDDPDELELFADSFKDISVIRFTGFDIVDSFLEFLKEIKPSIIVMDYNLGHTTADKILLEIGYEPEVFIISQEKGYEARFAGKKIRFFVKEQDYVFKIAIDIIKYLNDKS